MAPTHAFSSLPLALALLVGACGGNYPEAAEPAADADAAENAEAEEPKIPVEQAALPFEVLDRQGKELEADALYGALKGARAVCIGERHPNPHHHWAQLHLLEQIGSGQFALGMEMFQRPYQGVLDEYAAGNADDQALITRSGWEERWGYDFDLYRPMLELTRDRQGVLLALNVSTELRKKISDEGLEGLTEEERAQVPELDLENPRHRAWWDAIMKEMADAHGHHGGGDGDDGGEMMDKMYRTQILWDETMADTAARWLDAYPEGRVVILAGNGHCHDSAIVDRIKRRGHDHVVSVRPVIDTGEGEVADLLAQPAHDYLFVMKMPAETSGR